MKKVLVLLLVFAMVFAAVGCGKQAKEEAKPAEEKKVEAAAPAADEKPAEAAQVANPIVEYDSLEALNEKYGIRLCHPGVMGVTDEKFCAITGPTYDIAQYTFSLNGLEYTFRCASTLEDISGIYVDGGLIFNGTDTNDAIVCKGGYKAAKWFDINGQYCLTVKDEKNVLTEEGFANIAEEMKEMTFPGKTEKQKAAFYQDISGEYQDQVSQRATATFKALDDGSAVAVTVSWGSSASETRVWTMTCKMGEDGLLYYNDCKCVDEIYKEEGKEPETKVVYENGSGFFSYNEDDALIYWNGAADKECTECRFEKMPS